MRIRMIGALLASLACVVAGVPRAPATVPDAHAAVGGFAVENTAADRSQDVPGDWWTVVKQDLEESEYHISRDEGTAARQALAGWQAPNRSQNYRSYFTPEGIRVVPRTLEAERTKSAPWEWGLSLTAYGETPVVPGELSAAANRIDYRRGDLREWYVNDVRGLEQGFILTAPPPPSRSTSRSLITLEMAVSGNLVAKVSEDGQVIDFLTPAGVPVVRYGGLRVQDATGRDLKATIGMRDRTLGLRFAAVAVEYPVKIGILGNNPDWSPQLQQTGALYGNAVASAGDVNGDGYDDVIVGAPSFDKGQADEGRVWVYHGSPSGLITSAAFSAESNQVGAQYGHAVATAGDVNGDGFDDVIVGAPLFDNGQDGEGQVWVYHGSASGLIPSAAWIKDSDQPGALYGFAVAAAGDVNGDGYDDVIVGAPFFDSPLHNEGRVWVYHGGWSGLVSYAFFSPDGDEAGAWYGWAVATAGDVNGDGYDDVIVGAPAYGAGGRVWVYHGAASGLVPTAAFTAESNQASGGLYGLAVASAGDLNGDGYDDVIVGAPTYDSGQEDEGRVWVYHGAASGLVFGAAFTAEGDQAGALYGGSVATAGDVNGDGYDDVIVGAHRYTNGQTEEGQVWVYHGSASGLISLAAFRADGDQAGAGYGRAAASAGDVNGDGYDDVIVGAPSYNNEGQQKAGRVEVFHGPL